MKSPELLGKKFANTTIAEGDYVLGKQLGNGAFGCVFEGVYKRDGKKYAVKLFKPPDSLKDYQEFEREARRQSHMSHPNIVKVYSHGLHIETTNGKETEYPYLVMELVSNGTLRDRVHNNGTNLPIRETDIFVRQAVGGISYLHNINLVHQDLKPDNMMLQRRRFRHTPTLKIGDFGVAVSPQDATPASVGTAPFMAPEKWKKGSKTKSTDLYALGVIAYELLTGTLPIEARGGFPIEWALAHMNDSPPAFERILGAEMTPLHARLEKVVRKALEKEPEHRQASVEEFGREWRRAYRRGRRDQVVIALKNLIPEPMREMPTAISTRLSKRWERRRSERGRRTGIVQRNSDSIARQPAISVRDYDRRKLLVAGLTVGAGAVVEGMRTGTEIINFVESFGAPEHPTKYETAGVVQVREQAAWTNFFGHEVEVPPPPQELLEIWGIAKEKGLTTFEAHYLPAVDISRKTRYPGWQFKLADKFWQRNSTKQVKTSNEGKWVLVDAITDSEVEQNDPLTSVTNKDRLGASWNQTQAVILPSLADSLGIYPKHVRLMTALEYNLIGNVFHPEWQEGELAQWFESLTEETKPSKYRHYAKDNLTDVGSTSKKDYKHPAISSRPMIVFA